MKIEASIPKVTFHRVERLYYHVRHANGVSVDMEPCRTTMLKTAREEGAQCFELNRRTGVARRIL